MRNAYLVLLVATVIPVFFHLKANSLLASTEPTGTINEGLEIIIESDEIHSGEGIYIEVITEVDNVIASFPDPSGNERFIDVPLELKEGTTNTWVMPFANLYADGYVTYTDERTEGVKDGGRKIYTPFHWDKPNIPIIVKAGEMQRETVIQVEGNLLDQLVIRPVDPRKPFPLGVTSIWEKYEGLFQGIVNWWVK